MQSGLMSCTLVLYSLESPVFAVIPSFAVWNVQKSKGSFFGLKYLLRLDMSQPFQLFSICCHKQRMEMVPMSLLKGYSSVSLIHGLNHRETVLDSLLRNQVSRPLIYEVLSTPETTTRQQYTAVNGSKYKPPPKSHK